MKYVDLEDVEIAFAYNLNTVIDDCEACQNRIS